MATNDDSRGRRVEGPLPADRGDNSFESNTRSGSFDTVAQALVQLAEEVRMRRQEGRGREPLIQRGEVRQEEDQQRILHSNTPPYIPLPLSSEVQGEFFQWRESRSPPGRREKWGRGRNESPTDHRRGGEEDEYRRRRRYRCTREDQGQYGPSPQRYTQWERENDRQRGGFARPSP